METNNNFLLIWVVLVQSEHNLDSVRVRNFWYNSDLDRIKIKSL